MRKCLRKALVPAIALSANSKKIILFLALVALFGWGNLQAQSLALAPLESVRPSQVHSWLGPYLEFRLRSRLEGPDGLELMSKEAMFLAQAKGEKLPKAQAAIKGEFQQVMNQVRLNLIFTHAGTRKRLGKTRELEKLEPLLDQLAKQIGKELKADFQLAPEASFPAWENPRHRELLHQWAIARRGKLDRGQLLELYPAVKRENDPLEAAILGEMMLIAGPGKELDSKRYFRKIETLLQQALMKAPKYGRLHALLAESYYLMRSYPSWVEKTAESAVKHSPQDELGWLMLALARGPSSGGGKEALLQVDRLNPFLWPKKGDQFFFQNGLLQADLERAHKHLQQVKEPQFFR